MDSLRRGVSLMHGSSASSALTQALRNHALRPPITRKRAEATKVLRSFRRRYRVCRGLKNFAGFGATLPDTSHTATPKHAPANLQASATTSKILARKIRLKRKNILSFSYCFGSKIRHHPRGTVSVLSRALASALHLSSALL